MLSARLLHLAGCFVAIRDVSTSHELPLRTNMMNPSKSTGFFLWILSFGVTAETVETSRRIDAALRVPYFQWQLVANSLHANVVSIVGSISCEWYRDCSLEFPWLTLSQISCWEYPLGDFAFGAWRFFGWDVVKSGLGEHEIKDLGIRNPYLLTQRRNDVGISEHPRGYLYFLIVLSLQLSYTSIATS